MLIEWFKKLKKRFYAKQAKYSEPELKSESTAWWGSYTIAEGEFHTWAIGDLQIGIKRHFNEWQIGSWFSERSEHSDFPKMPYSFKKLAYRSEDLNIHFKPILAARPLACKLPEPIYIPAYSEVVLYILSPIWIQISSATKPILLEELASVIFSDTWLGENTLLGEIGYAAAISYALRLEDLHLNNEGVITPLIIKNQAKSELIIDTLNLPLPNLSIYADKYQHLWTESVFLKREGDNDLLSKIIKGKPEACSQCQLLSPARIELAPNYGLKQFFSSLA